MLDVLRRNAGSWAIKIILGFIAITFVWWGVGTYTESGRDTAATVGGSTITMGELAREVEAAEKVYRDVYGAAFTPEMAKTLKLRQGALDTLIQRTILLQEAKRLGLTASDEEVQREIALTPAFQVDGQFREDRYRGILQANRISPGEFEESKRQEVTLRKVEGLIAAGARVTDDEALEYYRLSERKIRLLVATADPAKAADVPRPTDAEIQARYDAMRETLRVPAKARLLVARFDPAVFGKTFQPSEEEIKAFHEGNADRFRSEEKRLIARILLPSGKKDREAARRKAEGMLPRLGKGKAEFDAVVKAQGRNGTRETWVAREDLKPEVADAVFQASVDAVVGPIETAEGLVLARVNQIRFPDALPLSQVRDRVVALLRLEKGKDAAVIKAYEAQGKAQEKKDLKGILPAYGIVPAETGWESDAPGPRAGGVPPSIVQDALLLPTGEVGPVKTIGDTHYLFQVLAKEESKVPELAAVRDRVVAAVAADRRKEAARSGAQKVLTGSKSSADLEANAKKAGLAVTATALFSPVSDPLPGALADAADARKETAVLSIRRPMASKILESGGRYHAAACAAEQPADENAWPGRKSGILKELAEQKKTRMMEAYIKDHRRKVKVEINPDALK